MADPQTAATGAVMRTSVLRQYALQAGFLRRADPADRHRLLALLPTAPVRSPRATPSVEPNPTRLDGCAFGAACATRHGRKFRMQLNPNDWGGDRCCRSTVLRRGVAWSHQAEQEVRWWRSRLYRSFRARSQAACGASSRFEGRCQARLGGEGEGPRAELPQGANHNRAIGGTAPVDISDVYGPIEPAPNGNFRSHVHFDTGVTLGDGDASKWTV